MGPEEAKAAGNDAFRRRDYLEAFERYTAALQLLPQLAAAAAGEGPAAATAGEQQQLSVVLLTNRSLALYRLGRYDHAAEDAEAALNMDGASKKAAFRAAAARLLLGDAAAAARHAGQLDPVPPQVAGAGGALPLGSAALQTHAAALLAHQQRVAVLERHAVQGSEDRVPQQVAALLQALAAEAEGEGEDEAGAPQLLARLAAVLGSSGTAAGAAAGALSCPESQPVGAGAPEAAAALEASVSAQGHRLLLFFLADPDPQCQQAAAAALQAAAQAAAGGRADTVLWPPVVWRRLAELSTSCGSGSSGAAAMQLLWWAAARDAWVRQHLLLHPLPVSGVGAAAAGVQTAPAPADGTAASSPVAQVAALLADSSRLQRLAPATVESAAQLLLLYASDAAAAEGLRQLGCEPLLALLRAAAAAEGLAALELDAQQPIGGAGSSADNPAISPSNGMSPAEAPIASARNGGAASRGLQAAEHEALQQLRQKRQQVYDARLVALRRCLLGAAAGLAGSSKELVMAEAVVEKQAVKGGSGTSCKSGSSSSGSSRKRSMAAGAFLTELLALARELHKQEPRRTAAVLGPNGDPCTYVKRRFAADFRDNPAGDFLLSLDLQDGNADRSSAGVAAGVLPGGSTMPQAAHNSIHSGSSVGSSSGRGSQGAAEPTAPTPTLLELALRLLLHTAAASATTAALLYRRDLFGLCQELCSYCTASVVAAGQQLYAAVADRVPAAAEELEQEGVVPGLAGLALHSSSTRLQLQAFDKLAALADTCSGDEFAMLCGLGPGSLGPGAGPGGAAAARQSAVFQAWQLASGDDLAAPAAVGAGSPGLQQAARRLLLRCCERAQRQQRLGEQAPPLGGAWTAIGRQALLQLLRAQQWQGPGASGAQLSAPEACTFPQLRRGFFSKPSAAAAATGRAPAPAKAPGRTAGLPQAAVLRTKESALQQDGRAAKPSATAYKGASHAYKSGSVVIEELHGGGLQVPTAAAPTAAEPAAPSPAAATATGTPSALLPGHAAACGNSSSTAGAALSPHAAGSEEVQRSRGADQQGTSTGSTGGVAAAGEAAEQGAAAEEEATAAAEEEAAEEEEEEEELRDVYDSSACVAADQRRARSEWLAVPPEKRFRWSQTSTDVSVHIMVPAGTRASEVQVEATGGQLMVGLRWYGRVLHGQLHRRIKARELHWCLEDSELHVLLAKADAGGWWKTLLEGGRERSHFEILREAVDADEPVQPYDQLDDSAKGLIERIQERQAYIAAGLIDPEGFDDFRVVLGDSSLAPQG